MKKNDVGYGCGERHDLGLSEYGIKVVERMNALGMLVDLSHVGDQTTDQAIELADFPVFSHSNARSICNSVRNKPDKQIKAIAAKGGIIGINAGPSFVKRTGPEIEENLTISDLLDHVDYIVDLIGTDFIGLGLDFIENCEEEETALMASYPEIYGLPSSTGKYEFPVGIWRDFRCQEHLARSCCAGLFRQRYKKNPRTELAESHRKHWESAVVKEKLSFGKLL